MKIIIQTIRKFWETLKTKNIKSKILFGLLVFLVILIIFFAGAIVGFNTKPSSDFVALLNKDVPNDLQNDRGADFEEFWKVWRLIDELYPKASETDGEHRVYGAISGLVGSLGDPYSLFFDPEDAKYFETSISGSFSGVGMEVGLKDGLLTVIAPLKNSPAEKAGILSGDVILEINGEQTGGITLDEAVNKIRGDEGTEVRLGILREGEDVAKNISITRATVNIPTINTKKVGDVFVIELYSFSSNSASLFQEALQKFIETGGTEKLIIDLRGNPGGYLESAKQIASWFLPAGEVIVTEDYGKGKQEIHRSVGYDVFTTNLKLAILVNGGSASASEIVAGALQDHDKAIIIGTKTFGKGSVQEYLSLKNGSSLKITVADWLTPDGVSISKNGLTPDILVERTLNDVKNNRDPQLDAAIKFLDKRK